MKSESQSNTLGDLQVPTALQRVVSLHDIAHLIDSIANYGDGYLIDFAKVSKLEAKTVAQFWVDFNPNCRINYIETAFPEDDYAIISVWIYPEWPAIYFRNQD